MKRALVTFGMILLCGVADAAVKGTRPLTYICDVEASDLPVASAVPNGSIAVCLDTDAAYIDINNVWADLLGGSGSGLSAADIDTSAELRGIVTDEVGTGALMFVGSNATTASALAANGANCPADEFPLGVSASGAAEGCTAVSLAAGVAPYGQYDPDKPPASVGTGGWREDFTGNTEATTSAWANQDGTAITFNYDGAFVDGDTTDEFHLRYVAAPANSDQTVTTKVLHTLTPGSADGCVLEVLHGGSEAAPSNITYLLYGNFSTDGVFFQSDTDYNPAAGTTTHGSPHPVDLTEQVFHPFHLQIRYTDSSRLAEAYLSRNGIDFFFLSSTTLAADPISWSYGVRRDGSCRFFWWQLRTDANRNDASDD